MIKILICVGYSGSGKDTVMTYIEEKLGWLQQSTIGPIKYFVASTFDIQDDICNRSNPKYRTLLSRIKDELVRFNPDIFIEYFEKIVESRSSVITTMRENSEIVKFKEHFGEECFVIKVEREETDKKAKNIYEAEIIKAWDMDNVKADYYVYNNGTFTELYNQVDKVIDIIKGDTKCQEIAPMTV